MPRRSWIAGALAAATLACRPGAPPRPAPPTAPGYTAAAHEVARWLRSVAVPQKNGLAWPDDALRPAAVGANLASGSAGTVLFFLALHRAEGSPEALDEARRGGDFLLAELPSELPQSDAFDAPSGLYTGVAGIGFVLNELYRTSGEARFRDGARRAVALLDQGARPAGRGVTWNGSPDVLRGGAGTGLFLLYAAREMGRAPALDLAVRAGRGLLGQGIAEHGGLTWRAFPGRDVILPNFSHGTAGVSYFLASLYAATRRREFLDGALAGARYLEAVARTANGSFLVPYGWPDTGWERPYDVGWAHGPAGTARLFYRLWQETGERRWLDLVLRCAEGLRQSGIPGPPREGFGKAPFGVDRRFGAAGVAGFFLALHRDTGRPEDLAFARQLTAFVLARSTRDAAGRYWPLPRFGFLPEPGAPAAFTGYFYGASGLGLLLLEAAAAERGASLGVELPDDPWRREARPQVRGELVDPRRADHRVVVAADPSHLDR